MDSQKLGGLASDQKIEKIFHAYGYSIPVGRDGRRLWPKRFKNEIGQRMNSGRLSPRDVAKTCGISSATAADWKKDAKREATGPHSTLKPKSKSTFVEMQVEKDVSASRATLEPIVFKSSDCEIQFPRDFPMERLAVLIVECGRKR
ncbi:hypothetical protein [Shimia sp. MMG029]|uniref:hypothetical protein n=1 Tax=Shimia sp. MMG029 TaxID=3021978 RepID=UPI0022FEEE19|nr:hypothetical protein [Shimia sp. MMG029]MDA5555131.1 hypothetical protein [Shimia sp. MMG029]